MAALNEALEIFVGTHNWANFCKAGRVARRIQEDRHYKSNRDRPGNDGGTDGVETDGGEAYGSEADGGELAEPAAPSEAFSEASSPAIRGSVYKCRVNGEYKCHVDGEEMLVIEVLGQAFFYNQIRQMVRRLGGELGEQFYSRPPLTPPPPNHPPPTHTHP